MDWFNKLRAAPGHVTQQLCAISHPSFLQTDKPKIRKTKTPALKEKLGYGMLSPVTVRCVSSPPNKGLSLAAHSVIEDFPTVTYHTRSFLPFNSSTDREQESDLDP